MTALLTCLVLGGGLVGFGFAIGRAYERERPDFQARVYVLPRHSLHHHRPARSVISAPPTHVRLVPYENESEPA